MIPGSGPGYRGAALGIALLLAAALPAPAQDGSGREAIRKVRELHRKGERSRALEGAREILGKAPDDIESHLLYQDVARGQVPPEVLKSEYEGRWKARKAGDTAFLLARVLPPAEADRLLADAEKTDPKSYWIHVGRSDSLARLGRAPAAEASALAALALRADDPVAAARAGAQCAAVRRWAAAEASYRKALAGLPSDTNVILGLAHALLRLKRYDEATAGLQPLRGGKGDPRVLLLDAGIAVEKGDGPGAERLLLQATSLDPADTDAALQLALFRLKKAEAAPRPAGKPVDPKAVAAEVAVLSKGATQFPDRSEFRYALGYAHEITGDLDAALADYRSAAELDPLDGDVLTAIGAILAGKGQMEDAAKEFQKALDRDPDDAGTLFQLGYVLDQQGKSKEAIPFYVKAVKLAPTDPRGWHMLGLAQVAVGKPKEAAASFQKAAELDPKSATYPRDLGEALYEGKGFQAAEAALLKATELDPKDDYAWLGLGRARVAQRKYGPAAEAYERVCELRPKDKEIHILLGAIYQEFLKSPEKALLHYEKYMTLGGDGGDVQDWIDEANAEIERKKK